jgi:hypothetical protein
MKREVKGILWFFSVPFFVVGVLALMVADRELGGWDGAWYQARLQYLAHVPPLMWPRQEFASETWAKSPNRERYRYAKDLLSSRRLLDRTPAEVGALLSDQVPAEATQRIYPLRPADFQNLWWVLVVEFQSGRVSSARRDVAWLD